MSIHDYFKFFCIVFVLKNTAYSLIVLLSKKQDKTKGDFSKQHQV